MTNKINMPFKTDIKKQWPTLEGNELALFIKYFRGIVCGNYINGVVYYYTKMTNKQQGKVSGFADCIQQINYNMLSTN